MKININIGDKLNAELKKLAENQHRSRNAQILFMLENSLRTGQRQSGNELSAASESGAGQRQCAPVSRGDHRGDG